MYATNHGGDSGFLWVINGKTNRVLKQIVLGSAGFGVAVNPTSNRIYAGQMEVINGANNTALGTVPVEGGASSVAVNPATNRVYAIGGPSTNDGQFVGGHVAVIVECTLDEGGDFVCP